MEATVRAIASVYIQAAELVSLARDIVFPSFVSERWCGDAAQLERRILLSASPLAVMPAVEMADSDPAADLSTALSAMVDQAQSSFTAEQDPYASAAASVELVFVDGRLPDVDRLIADIQGQTDPGRDIEVYWLDRTADGILQMDRVLSDRSNIAALHLVTHASDGLVQFGDVWLSNANLGQYATTMAGWNASLQDGADWFFYGCDLAVKESGRMLLETVGTLCDCDIAASVDDTGHARFGADWDLEFVWGDVESELVFSSGFQQSWDGKLATILVDTVDDVVDAGDGFTSLREAINQANAGDIIQLSAGTYLLDENAGASDELFGDLDISQDVTIVGVAASTTIIDASGLASADRVLEIVGGVTVRLSDVTLRGGDAGGGDGGGILVDGNLQANRLIVTGNRAANGAGLYQIGGSTSLSDFVITLNDATNNGGGLAANSGTVVLERGEVSQNTADQGAGIFDTANSLSLTNVTVYSNVANLGGGGIWTEGALTSVNSTIAFNDGDNGAGTTDVAGVVRQGAGTGTFTNTILHNPQGNNASAGFTDGGNNIVTGVSAGLGSSADPLLGAAGNHGGFSRTIAITPASSAYNAGAVGSAPSVDQRGFAREDGSPDIGAFEVPQPTLVADSERLVNTVTAGEQVTRGDNHPAGRGSQRAVAIDRLGNSVVVWSDSAADGNGWGIFGQRFDVTGNLLGAAFQINTNDMSDEYHASVAMDDQGRFVVVFTADDDTGTGVYLRRFESDGTAIDSADILVNAGQTAGNQSNASIAVNGLGQIVVTWQSESAGIYARTFDMTSLAPGDQLPTPLITVDSDALAIDASVDINNAGRYVIVWDQDGDLSGMRYDFGSTVALSAKHDLSFASSSEHSVVVAVQEDNEFVIAYRSDINFFQGVWTTLFQENGNMSGLATRASSQTTAVDPSIAMGDNGDYVVVFQDADADGIGVFGRKYDASRVVQGSEFQVNDTTLLDQHRASVDVVDLDNFMVVWSGNGDQAGEVDADGVFVRRFVVTNNAPTFTSLASPVDTTSEDTEVEITFTELVAAGDEADTDGTVDAFVVVGFDSGSLRIGADAGSATAWISGSNDRIDASNHAYWTPESNTTGLLNSFRVVARDDGGLESGSPVAVSIDVSSQNDAPVVVNSIGNQTATEDLFFSFQFAANTFADADGDTLSYTALQSDSSPLPGWLSFDSATRTFSGTPSNGDVGSPVIRVTASDGNGGTVFEDFTLTVSNTNDAPTVANAIGNQAATEDLFFSFQFAANTFADADGDPLSYTALQSDSSPLPGWLSFDGATRTFSGTPSNGDVGSPVIRVTASDGNGGTVFEDFTLTVTSTNDAPTVANAIGNQTATEDLFFSFQFAANTFADADGDTLSYTALQSDSSPLPGWLSFDGATRTFSGTPSNGDVGSQVIRVTASDGNGGTVFEDFTLTVSNTNDAPTVANAIGNQTATEGAFFSFQFAANTFADVDGDTLSYTALQSDSSPLPGWLSFDGATRTFSGTPSNGDVGSQVIRVTASDGNGGTVFEDFTLTVSNTNDAPTVANAIGNQTATEDLFFSFQFAANTFADADGDPLSYTALQSDSSPLPGWLSFDGATRTFSGTPSNGDVGSPVIRVTASDGNGGTVFEDFTLTVSNTNDAPTVANAIGNQTATEDAFFSFQFAANTFADVDGDPLSYTASQSDSSPLPGWLSFDGATRTFSGTPSNGDVGSPVIRVTASDGNGGTVFEDFTLTVSNTNDAPTVANAIGNQTATEDAFFSFQFAANTFADADGDPLSYTALQSDSSPLPGWLSFDGAMRTFSGTPSNGDVGSPVIRVTASDGNGGTVFEDFTLTVSNTNDAPTVANAIGNQTATEDAFFSFQFAANTFADVDGDPLSYTASQSDSSPLPGWLSFDGATRTFSGTPDSGDLGAQTIRVTASDGNGGSVFEDFTLTVVDVNDAPTDISPNAFSIDEDTNTAGGVSLGMLSASDPDAGETFVFSIGSGGDAGSFAIGGLGGDELILITNALDHESKPSFTVNVRVTDSALNVYSEVITIAVNDVDESPVAIDDTYTVVSTSLASTGSGVLTNDFDPEGSVLTATLVTPPQNGTLVLLAGGGFTYTPDDGFVGIDVFVYQANDGTTVASQATVRLIMTAPAPAAMRATEVPETAETSESSEQREPESPTTRAADPILPSIQLDVQSGPSLPTSDRRQADLGELERRASLDRPAILIVGEALSVRHEAVDSTFGTQAVDPVRRLRLDPPDMKTTSLALSSPMSAAFFQAFDEMRDEVRNDMLFTQATIGASLAATTSLSVGYVIWLIRGGVLLSSVVSSLPAWHMIDPLPVLGYLGDDDLEARDDESLENLVARSNRRKSVKAK